MRKIKIGLLGLGQVGSGVYRILSQKKSLLSGRAGVCFEVSKILVRNPRKKRLVKIPKKLLTTKVNDILRDPEIDIVVELTGGLDPIEKWYYEAFQHGKDIVTANKALLAERGDKLFKAANQMGRQIFFEASVGGGIPVIKSLREGLIANKIDSVLGIVNGTSNYILTQMSQNKMDFKEALKLAQEKGFAEADPTFDIKGVDAAHKLSILIRLGFNKSIVFSKLKTRGIDSISAVDIECAKSFGYVIKLIAQAKTVGKSLLASVEPLLLKEDHVLAKVDGAFNAILFDGDEVGDALAYGQGAGSRPTASAVVSDLCDLAKEMPVPVLEASKKEVLGDLSVMAASYYLRFSVVDQPDVLSKISHFLGKEKISIAKMIQIGQKAGNVVPVILITHHCTGSQVDRAVSAINKLKCVSGKTQKIRIEE